MFLLRIPEVVYPRFIVFGCLVNFERNASMFGSIIG